LKARDGYVVITEMPTVLTLYYTAVVQVTVPNKIARKLKEAQGDCVQNSEDAPFAFGNKWGNLYYQGKDGKEHKIEGETLEIDYKRTENGEWQEEEESDDESEAESDSEAESESESESESEEHEIMPPA